METAQSEPVPPAPPPRLLLRVAAVSKGTGPRLFLRRQAHGEPSAPHAGLGAAPSGLIDWISFFLWPCISFCCLWAPEAPRRFGGAAYAEGDHSVPRHPRDTPNFPPGGSVYMISITCNYHGRTIN